MARTKGNNDNQYHGSGNNEEESEHAAKKKISPDSIEKVPRPIEPTVEENRTIKTHALVSNETKKSSSKFECSGKDSTESTPPPKKDSYKGRANERLERILKSLFQLQHLLVQEVELTECLVLLLLIQTFSVDKPQASSSASAEIYIVGFKYKAPTKIDQQLLDVKHVIQGGKEPPKVVDVLRGTKQKRHRDGYEDGDTTLRKDHTLTTDDVKDLCDDLRVLGKQDFKHLLKWRIHIRKALSLSEKATSATMAVERESKQDEDERIFNEMEELTNAMEQKKERAKKLLAKRRAKDKARKALGKQIDATEESYTDHELFSPTSIKADSEGPMRKPKGTHLVIQTPIKNTSGMVSNWRNYLKRPMKALWLKRKEARSRESVQSKPIPRVISSWM
ncbi:unnamed protein product [Fraxinus pennsylvanica]|uniref:DUF3381 domain-containing protein n=1 Tax=Fraxinus pennsylvanica TaxID=56036 RepID=A0AAD1ZSM7_9LAMI|nr:unnamed protein product [Fraxinus pennsylvanica]